MKKILEIYSPLITAILMPSAILLGSKIKNGDWFKWIKQLPFYIWFIFGIVIVLWTGIIVIRKINVKFNKKYITNGFVSIYTNNKVGEIKYNDVIWTIFIPKELFGGPFSKKEIDKDYIEISTNPLCPKCKTELEERQNILWGFNWKCIKCGFNKKNRYNIIFEKERALKIAKSEWDNNNS